jgi:hypothetical protein
VSPEIRRIYLSVVAFFRGTSRLSRD